jgi:hypothetical protein
MDVHLMFKEHHNRCIKTARAAEASLPTLTKTYGVVSESLPAVQVACIQALALNASELWWDPREIGRQDDLQLLNRQPRSILGSLPTTLRGALMRESGHAPAPVIVDSRQPRFTERIDTVGSSNLNVVHKNPSSGHPTA